MPENPVASIIIDLDTAVFRLNAIKKAAYRLGNRAVVVIELIHDRRARVVLTPRGSDSGSLEAEFRQEILDQDLREIVAEETDGIRRLLIAQAFSMISLTDRNGEVADYADDPLDIRRAERI